MRTGWTSPSPSPTWTRREPADFDPLAEYDADKSGALDKDEVIQAINDYLFGVGADAISKDDVIETINLYLFG